MLKKIAPCFFAIIIDALGFGLVYPTLAALFTAANSPVLPIDATGSLRHFYLGLGYMLYPLCMFFGASFMGDLSDVWGRKRVLLICMFGISLSFCLMAVGVLAQSLWLLFLGRGLSGLAAGSQPIAQACIADISTNKNKAKNMALISMSYSVGVVLGPLIGGVMSDQALVGWFNYATPFIVAATLALIAVIWLFFFKDTHVVVSHKKLSLIRPIQIFIEAFYHKTICRLALVFLLMQVGFSIYFQFIIVHMKYVHHYSNWQLGALQGMLGLGFALGILIGIPLALRYFKPRSIAIITLFLTGFLQLVSAMITVELLQWPLAVFIAVFDMMAFSSLLTLFSNAVNDQLQGWVMGISGSVMAVAWIITGLSANSLSLLTTATLIAIGGGILILSSIILYRSGV
ncbi:MAG: MFS transporter [Gammaproteobacteria bacterium]|nr:MAG: MFS transporter [Gammaproteobacteria bacterium]UTW42537.1 MFS transporter [bacterium SCSIO 12844]